MLPPTPPTIWDLDKLLADLAAQEWAQRPVTQTNLRDAIASLRAVTSTSVNVKDVIYGAKGDGVTDDSTAFSMAHAIAAATGQTLLIPPGTYLSSFMLNPAGFRISAWGARYLYNGTGTACRWGDYGYVEGLKFLKSGAAGSSIACAIGAVGITAHSAGAFFVEVEGGFNDGWVQQLSFYGAFFGVISRNNVARNYRLTNTAISNDYVACKARGQQLTLVNIQCDDTTSNSSSTRWHGGTIEGAVVQNVDILGADSTFLNGPHIEQNAPVSLTGTLTFTNGATAVTGSGTSFLSQVKQGQYIKLDSDTLRMWMRVQTITDDTNIVLSEGYQGTSAGGASSVVGGNVRMAAGSGAAINGFFVGIEYAIASGSCPALYVQNGSNPVVIAGDLNQPVLLGASATRANIYAATMSGQLDDRGSSSKVLADADNSRAYWKNALNKVIDFVAGGTQFQAKSTNPIQTPPILLVAAQGGSGTGISATNTAAKNLRGTVTVTGAATTGTATFAVAEADASYTVNPTPSSSAGTPAAGSNRVLSVSKAAGSFTITVEVAPGVGNSVTFDWILVR